MRDRTEASALPAEGGDIKMHFHFVKAAIKKTSFLGGATGNYDLNRWRSL